MIILSPNAHLDMFILQMGFYRKSQTLGKKPGRNSFHWTAWIHVECNINIPHMLSNKCSGAFYGFPILNLSNTIEKSEQYCLHEKRDIMLNLRWNVLKI